MQSSNYWKPSKFVYRNDRLTSSMNTGEVIVESRFAVTKVAAFYDRYLRIYAKGKLLDLGCGKVPLYAAYRDYIQDNICIDWADTFHKNAYLDFEHDLNEKLPLQDDEFDTIILSDVLEHIKNPGLLWEEMNRVLKKDGILIMNVPFFYWLHEVPHDYFRYTEYALKKFADDSHFEILVLDTIGGVPEVLTDITAKMSRRIPFAGKQLSIAIQSLSSFFISTGFGKRVSKNTGKDFPFGYFLVARKL